MSRSFKKNAILKDGGRSHRYHKKLSSSKLRAKNKDVFANMEALEDKIFPDTRVKDLIDPYYICDHYWILDLTPRIWIDYAGNRQVRKLSFKWIKRFTNK